MSFWSSIGNFFTGGGGDASAATAYNQAQVAAMHDPNTPLGRAFAATQGKVSLHDNFVSNSAVAKSADAGVTQALGAGLSALSYVPVQADRGVSAASLHSQGLDWNQAWNATGSAGATVDGQHLQNVNVGQLAYNIIRHDTLGTNQQNAALNNQKNIQQFTADQNTWTGKIASGAIDVAATWYADPTIVLGKGAKLARAANQVQDASRAERAVAGATDINRGVSDINHNPFSTGMERSGSLMFKFAKSMDNGGNQAGRQVFLNRTPETAPFLGLMDQIDKVPDLELQRQARIDVIGTSQASDLARQRLIETVPEIARAQQRISLAPEGREALDSLHSALAGVDHTNPQSLAAASQAWVDSAVSFDTVENRAEIAALHQRSLRHIHESIEGLDSIAANTPIEQAGLTALDRAKAALRDHIAQDFHYQDGPSSRTIRVLHWATNQRFRGTIATDNAMRGNQELMDWMTKTKATHPETGAKVTLFSGEERQAASTALLTAPTQEARRRIVDNLWGVMYKKVGDLHGVDADTIKKTIDTSKTFRQAGVRYTTKQLEAARLAGDDVVTLDDAALGTPTRLKHSLLETHIANNVSLPDPTEIADHYRKAKYAPTTMDQVGQKAAQFSNGIDHFNNVWRLSVLGRPGLLIRTQVDTQGRALAVMGGSAWVHSALTGLGHWAGKDLKNDALLGDLTPEQFIDVDAMASDRALADQLRSQAADLRGTANTHSRIRKQRQGVDLGATPAPATLDERGAVLRGEGKSTDLPLSADALAATSPEAMHARADALEAQATTLENRKYRTDRFRQGTKNEKLHLKGGKSITTRLASGEQDLADLQHAVYKDGTGVGQALTQTAPQSVADLLDRSVSREQKRLYEDSHNWVTHSPDDPHWSAGWIRTMDQLRNSYTGRKVLNLADTSTKDLVEELRRDPRVRAEYREVRSDNLDFNGWLGRMVNTVAWNAPSKEIREALNTKGHMSPDEVDSLFAKSADDATKPQKMFVQGPSFSFKPPEGTKPTGVVRKMISALSDTPDLKAGRHPVLVDRYRKHVTDLANRQFAEHPEWDQLPNAVQAKIERVAKHRAVQDVQQIMYDTAKHTGAHNTLRYISPFMGAWQDAIESWSRLFYDNPATAGAFNKVWNVPNRMGLVVDENGDAIQPGQHANQSFLVLPAQLGKSFSESKKYNIRKDSLNSIFQGAQWYTPGVGPVVQVPAAEIIAKVYPEIGDSKNPLVQTLLPFGTPKTATGGGFIGNLATDVANSTAPSYVKALYSMVNPSDPSNGQAYLASVNQQIIDARKAGKPIPSKDVLNANAAAAARSVGFVKAISIWGLGVSGTQTNVADFYKKQYDLLQSQAAILHKQGTTPTEEFVKNFPEAAGLKWSLSKSQTGVNANLQAFDDEKKYSKQIKANPAYGWFYVGASNISPNVFSQSVYNAQSSREIGLPGGGAERQRQTRSQVIDSSLAEDGWQKYNALQIAVQQSLTAQGLTSINQGSASNIKAAKDAGIKALRAQNPAWAADFDNQDAGKLQRFIETVATPAVSDPALKNRSDIQALGQYLEMRTIALDFLAKNGGAKSLSATTGIVPQVRAALDAAGTQLASQNLGFQQMWTRMLSSEVQSASQKQAA